VGIWHDLDLGRPIAAPLERCAELLGVDLASIREPAGNVEPYIRAEAPEFGASGSLERQLRPGGGPPPPRRRPRPPTGPPRMY